jgi:hypothetical protein
MLAENEGPDVDEKVSDVIAPHGCCTAYKANYDKLHDTHTPAEGVEGPERNRETITTADVV